MTLTKKESIFVISDVTGPVLSTSLILLTYFLKKINFSLLLTYFYGFLIGCLWEIPFGLLGDNFLEFTFDNPLGFYAFILHAFWDSIIFLIGLYMVSIRNNNKYCGIKQLLLMILWGIFQNFIVELILNNNYWYYGVDNKYNPVLFTINDNSFTFLPFLVWIVSPILYISGVYSIVEKYGSFYGNNSINLQSNLRTNLIESTCAPEIDNKDNTSENIFYRNNPMDINYNQQSGRNNFTTSMKITKPINHKVSEDDYTDTDNSDENEYSNSYENSYEYRYNNNNMDEITSVYSLDKGSTTKTDL